MDINFIISLFVYATLFLLFSLLIGKIYEKVTGTKICIHRKEMQRTRVIYSTPTCETTATFCGDCGKQLTDAKTDCR